MMNEKSEPISFKGADDALRLEDGRIAAKLSDEWYVTKESVPVDAGVLLEDLEGYPVTESEDKEISMQRVYRMISQAQAEISNLRGGSLWGNF